jgi:hypothetical protein
MNRIFTFDAFVNEGKMNHEMGDLIVKTSTIPNAGNGLFAQKAFKKGSKIAEYTGTVISAKAADKKASATDGSADYLINLSTGKVLDVFASKCLAGIANDAEGFVKTKGFANNSEIQEDDEVRVWLVATKNIPAGGEILVGYGEEYWKVWKENNNEVPQEIKPSKAA